MRLWDLADPDRPVPWATPLSGHGDAVGRLACSRDGRTLATASVGRHRAAVGRHRSRAAPRELATLTGHTGAPYAALALQPRRAYPGHRQHDRTVRLWDITDPRHPHRSGHPHRPRRPREQPVAFSPDGHTLATAGLDGTVRLWDVTDPRRPRALARFAGHVTGANAAVFSPDGHRPGHRGLATALCGCGTSATPAAQGDWTRSPTLTEGVSAVAFSPDGDTLATTEFGGATRLWSVTGRRLHQTAALGGHVGAVYSPAFSPDGNTLATVGADHTARLWDTTDPDHPHALASLTDDDGHTTAVFSAVFGPGGHTLATAGADRTARLWATSPQRVAAQVCRLSHPRMTRSEWRKYFGNLTYRPPCP